MTLPLAPPPSHPARESRVGPRPAHARRPLGNPAVVVARAPVHPFRSISHSPRTPDAPTGLLEHRIETTAAVVSILMGCTRSLVSRLVGVQPGRDALGIRIRGIEALDLELLEHDVVRRGQHRESRKKGQRNVIFLQPYSKHGR